MPGFLFKKLHFKKILNHEQKKSAGQYSSSVSLSQNLEENLRVLREALGSSSDVIIRDMKISSDSNIDAAVVYIDGLVDRALLNHDIL
ncbi:MAG TPA: spore germination protein, partial [Syntrophomonas wolfei]|nr:spore germination protein [Syntrophomonas wolfei]